MDTATNILNDICEAKREHLSRQKALVPLSQLENRIRGIGGVKGFQVALQKATSLSDSYGLIAEIKCKSPSSGIIRNPFNPVECATDYQTAGATCLSILTDKAYFAGTDEDLLQVAMSSPLPCLRKDFMIDPYQIAESRALGADCVLLIVAALDDARLRELHAAATHYKLDILIEVHNSAELDRALLLPSGMIGINNRNLATLVTDLATTEALAPRVPKDRLLVSESGIRNHEDLVRMAAAGAKCFLVGEHLLREDDLVGATRRLLGTA